MSRLTDLIAQAKAKDPQLGADLESEFRVLSERRPFGLNFERHQPEAVELPSRPVRKGDKVRVLPPRGTVAKGDPTLWRVAGIDGTPDARVARLAPLDRQGPDDDMERFVPVADLVVVAEFRDPIYPGLVSTGSIERGGPDKPFHTVINAENYHALQTLLFTHRGKVDCIYIDPPYNTGAKDWKYNNDYVDGEDLYRHSKWLAFMERRLILARQLLNPEDSVLIVTIDEKEYLRCGLLLGQVFPDAHIQMVTSVISAKGVVRVGQFSRVEEYVFFVLLGRAQVTGWASNMLTDDISRDGVAPAKLDQPIEWLGLRRREPSSVRGARPNQFYPILLDARDGQIVGIGEAVADDVDRKAVRHPEGTVALWPVRPDGTESLWGLTPDVLRRNWKAGYVKVNWNARRQTGTPYYLPTGTIKRIESGEITVTGRAADGSVEGHVSADAQGSTPPRQVWNMRSHNAEVGGTNMLSALLPGRRFPFPKSLFAVEDAMRFCIGLKPDAVVLDFFAGSGTTEHAVMRLNRQDGGRRQCISVTNNEVSAEEQASLRRRGLRPGDPAWEELGICDYITKPRLRAAVTGRTPDGNSVKGAYRFTDEFPMSEGFEENVEFLDLTYETPWRVARHRAFDAVAPLLWLRAGARGRSIDGVPEQGWDVADVYGILVNLDRAKAFAREVAAAESVRLVFVVTDDDRRFQMVCGELPDTVEVVRLYESYLRNFEINTGRE